MTRRRPRLLLAACACLGATVFLTLVGIGLALLPEGFDVEWNDVPLSEYDLGDLAGGIILFGLVGAVLAAIHLARSKGESSRRERRLAVVLVVVGLVPFVVVAAIVGLLIAFCSTGACS
jgi:nitrogen fixation/metabolism regulation signal transduction histidine kinase